MAFDPISAVAGVVGTVADKLFTDKTAKAQFEHEFEMHLLTHRQELESTWKDVMLAETKGDSWFGRSWRPFLMFVIVLRLAIDWLFLPVFNQISGSALVLPPLPDWAGTAIITSIGVYAAGRSAEKTARHLSRGSKGDG